MALGMAVGIAFSAQAVITDGGTRYCSGSFPVPYSTAQYIGELVMRPPGYGSYFGPFYNPSNAYQPKTLQGLGSGGSWFVQVKSHEGFYGLQYSGSYCSPP